MPTYGTTTKYALRKLLGGNLISDIDTGFDSLASDVDANMAGYTSGTIGSRPAAGKAGLIYRASDSGQVSIDNGGAWIELAPSYVTSLPGSPYDGQEIYYQADGTNGVIWHLRYRSGSASSSKWEFVGGGSLTAEVATSQSTASSSFTDLATVGPSITVPLAGDYEMAFRATALTASGTSTDAAIGIKIGAAAVGAADTAFTFHNSTIQMGGTIASSLRRNVAAASTVVKMVYEYQGLAGTVTFQDRDLSIRPIRVG